jgi:hypothetical protein
MHGVFDVVARDKEIAVDVRKRNVRNDEAVAVVMEDETAANFVPGGGFVLGNFFSRFCGSGSTLLERISRSRSPPQEEAAMRKLLDQTAFLEFGEHREQGAAVILFEVQGAGEFLEGHRVRSKL